VLDEFGDRVTLIGVAALDDNSAMRAFVTGTGLTDMVHIDDSDLEVWMRFGITGQPAWVLVDDDGTTEIRRGAYGEAGLAEAAQALIGT